MCHCHSELQYSLLKHGYTLSLNYVDVVTGMLDASKKQSSAFHYVNI